MSTQQTSPSALASGFTPADAGAVQQWPAHLRTSFVAAGPGDPGLMTVRGAQLLGDAEVVLVDDPAPLAELLAQLAPSTRVVVLGADHTPEQVAQQVQQLLGDLLREPVPVEAERVLVRLLDPGVEVGALSHPVVLEEIAACRSLGIEVDLVPGVPFTAAALAYAGLRVEPGTGGETPQVRDIDADSHHDHHGEEWAIGDEPEDAADPDVVAVVHGSSSSVAAALRRLRALGRAAGTPVVLVTGGTTTSQRTRAMTLRQAISAVTALEGGSAGHDERAANEVRVGEWGSPDRGQDSQQAENAGPGEHVEHGEQVLVVVGPAVATDPSLDWFESLPLFDWRILVPRTQEQSGAMLARLARYGARGDVVPTIAVQPPRNPQLLEKAVAGLITGRYEWLGFTSTNAVRAIRERFEELGMDARSLAGVKVAAVGGITAQALRDWGIEPDLVPSGPQSAAGLLQEWPAYDPDLDPLAGVLLPRADIATDTLVAGLTELGWQVDDVTAYRTVRASPPAPEIRAAIKHGDFDAVVFTSSSTVRNLLGIAGKPHAATVVACIGPATAQTARDLGLEVHVVAAEQSAAALVDALAEYGRSLAQETPEGLRTPRPRERPGRRRTSRS